jgi:hypothetical protein
MPAGPKQVSVGGAADSFVADAVNKIPEGSLVILAGLADVIPPHSAGNYIANNATGADLTTLAAPTAGDSLAGGDDGKIIRFTSASAFAHKITSTGNLQSGTNSVNSVALAAFAGASVTLMAFNGKWIIISSNAALTLA